MAAAPASIRRARPLLGTFVEIAVARAPMPTMAAAVEAAFAAVAKVHRLMSFHDADSDVSRLNRPAAMDAIRVHEWTYRVLEIALDLHRRSGGAFDVTIAPVLQQLGLLPSPLPPSKSAVADLDRFFEWPNPRYSEVRLGRGRGWGSANGAHSRSNLPNPHPDPPPQGGREQAAFCHSRPPCPPGGGVGRSRGTSNSIELLSDNHIRFAHPKVRIDLGGIAKGFAVDRAIDALRRHGMTEGLVNAGGDLGAFGGADHAVDIRDPRRPDRAMCRIALSNAALASSAARIDRLCADASASAVIDPATRMPAHTALGATVLAPCCVVADALTKVVMTAGEKAAPILEHYGASALFVKANGEVLATAGWSNRHAA